MKRPVTVTRIALPAIAAAAALAAILPATAAADPIQCGPAARAQAMADSAPKTAAFLSNHPDFAAELQKVRALPKEQRRAEWAAFRDAHQQEWPDWQAARRAVQDYRAACHPGQR
ncbi:hemophore-related protein [Skermania piniformis]|uniref:Hemophore-related protein n=1 Tax=Skermania pinensis TaxID=39122 RepID=A0ABX8S8Q7_9ACTN|nr:hemophore-related protein [Skermania piniformis]QXQ13841.1 hemophore-related protein [Skermania piniformis]